VEQYPGSFIAMVTFVLLQVCSPSRTASSLDSSSVGVYSGRPLNVIAIHSSGRGLYLFFVPHVCMFDILYYVCLKFYISRQKKMIN